MSGLGGLVEYIVRPQHVGASPPPRQQTFTEHLLCAGHWTRGYGSAHTDPGATLRCLGGQEKVQNGPILGKRKYLCKGKSGSLYTRVRIHVSCGWWVCEWFLFLYDFLGFYTDFNRTILNLFETYWGNIGQ